MPAIGIDLGTTNSCVAAFRNGRAEVIANDRGNRTTPSCVAFTDKERLVGEAALRQLIQNAENTVFEVKRLIGRNFPECAAEIDLKQFPFEVISDNDVPKIKVRYKGVIKQYTAIDISAMILTKMKQVAEAFLDETITDAVITVPAYFNNSQRRATKAAANMAGLNVLQIVNEPTAAAIAYGVDKNISARTNILIFDLGGGTFDVSILTVEQGEIRVRCTAGQTNLGGANFVDRMVNHFIEQFRLKHGKDLSQNRRSRMRLREKCEQVKCDLSSTVEAYIQLDALFESLDMEATIDRSLLNKLNADLFEQTIEIVGRAIVEAGLKKHDLDCILLVGGSTRIVKLQAMLREYFMGKELKYSINPDEAVACGAAILAAKLTGNKLKAISNIRLRDVIPLSLGLNTDHHMMVKVIPRNTVIPITKTKCFYSSTDDQRTTFFKICEGERAMVKDNHVIGRLEMSLTKPVQYGEPICDVEFHVDESGILDVTEFEKGTENTKKIRITDESFLGQGEIAHVIASAEEMKMTDERYRQQAQAKVDLRNYVYHIKHSLEALGLNDFSVDQQNLTNLYTDTLDWLSYMELKDVTEYQSKRKHLEQLWNRIEKR